MIGVTKDGDRIAIYIELKKNGEEVGYIGWANSGKQLLVGGATPENKAAIDDFIASIVGQRKIKVSRPLVRAVARAWDEAASENSVAVVLDTHSPSLSPVNLADLPFALLKRAYWRPQALGLRKDNVDAKAEQNRRSRLPHFLLEKWPKEETWVGKVLDQLLAGAPPRAVGDAFAAVDNRLQGCAFGLWNDSARALRAHVGDPDFILFDESKSALVLGEIKISAKATNGRYSFEQFSKYMLYAALAQLSGLAKTVTHLLVAPSLEPSEFCNDAKLWEPRVQASSGRLSVTPSAVRLKGKAYGKKNGYRDFESWRRYAADSLLDEEWREANPGYGKAEVERLLNAKTSPVLVSTYVVTWDRLCSELAKSCEARHAGHLVPAIEKLRKLGTGQR